MTPALWIILTWIAASFLFVVIGSWWVNRHPDDEDGDLCPVRALYPEPRLEGRATPQNPPKGTA